jgi:hypothetical protein
MSERDESVKPDEPELDAEAAPESSPAEEDRPAPTAVTLETARSRRGVVAALVLVVVFAAGVALWPLILPSFGIYPPAQPWPGAVEFAERVAALEDRAGENARLVRTIHGEISGLADRLAAAPAEDEAAAALREEVAGIATRMAALDERLGAVEDRFGALSDRLGALEAAPATAEGEATPEALTKRLAALERAFGVAAEEVADAQDLRGETEALGRRTATLDDRLEALTARLVALEELGMARAAPEESLVVMVDRLGEALRGSAPYDDVLAAVRALAAEDAALTDAIDLLAPGAVGGVATVAELRQRFAAQAGAILRAERGDEPSGWIDLALDRLADLISVRRVGEIEGEGAEARVARAEARLAADDLAAAVAEIKELDGAAAEAASGWLAAAETRLAAEAGLAALRKLALDRLAGVETEAQ